MAYGAGQFAKLQSVSERFPYWEYSTAKDERVRESHRELEGKIFKSSDSQYYPPLGFNCRCRAIPISLRQAEIRGIKKPDLVTAEMRANLANAEFIGDKVGNFAAWLNEKMGILPVESVVLITEKLTEVETQLAELAAEADKIAADQAQQDANATTPIIIPLKKRKSKKKNPITTTPPQNL
jgi:hypothetical protein